MSQYNSLDDILCQASSYTTSEPDGSVLIRSDSHGFSSASVPKMVKNHCLTGGGKTALVIERNGVLVKWSYDHYYRQIREAAKGFIKLGLEPFYSVCIYSFNCPEWLIANMGAIFARGLSAGLYPTNSAAANEYLMNNCRCQILVVENASVLRKVEHILKNVPSLKKVVVIEEEGFEPSSNSQYILWKDLIALGSAQKDEELNSRLRQMRVNQCCSLIYTSGTTGNPKGVMLSHDILTFMTKALVHKHGWANKKYAVVSYLPLSHIAATIIDVYISLYLMGEVHFADKSALKGTLVETLKSVRPTVFLGVPRVWEKFHEGIVDKSKNLKKSQLKVTKVFKDASMHYYQSGHHKMIHKIGDKLIFQKIKAAMGLEQCVEFLSGGAPLSTGTREFFLSIDIPIQECYGLSECGIFSSAQKSDFKSGTCGTILPSTFGRIAQTDSEIDEGELSIKGRCVMMGYINNPEATQESFDEDGYFHTGDIAFRDKGEHFWITGRLKDILITAGGENVSPILIENAIKLHLPVISNVVAVGDREKFISVFLTFKVKTNEAGEQTNLLADSVLSWLQNLGCKDTSVGALIFHCPQSVMNAIQKGIDEANRMAVSNSARVKKWTILPRDLSEEAGELGPTLKLKRGVFTKKHARLVHKLCS